MEKQNDDFQKAVIELINSNSTDSDVVDFFENYVLTDIDILFLKKHDIVPLFIYNLSKIINLNNSYYKVFEIYRKKLIHSKKQDKVLSEITEILIRNNIDFIPLKGSFLKKLYFIPEIRTMGDIDILIKEEQLPKCKTILLENDYSFLENHAYEYTFTKNNIKLELHISLIDSVRSDFNFTDILNPWINAKCINNSSYFEMDLTSNLVYLIYHAAKHIRNRGAGIRFFYDLKLFYGEYCDQIDRELFEKKLIQLKLGKFTEYISTLLNKWFGIEDFYPTKINASDINNLELYILSGGIFGIDENQSNSAKLRNIKYFIESNSGKFTVVSFIKEVLFPSNYNLKELMSRYIRWLRSLPIQYRTLVSMYKNRRNIKQQQELMNTLELNDLFLEIKR